MLRIYWKRKQKQKQNSKEVTGFALGDSDKFCFAEAWVSLLIEVNSRPGCLKFLAFLLVFLENLIPVLKTLDKDSEGNGSQVTVWSVGWLCQLEINYIHDDA